MAHEIRVPRLGWSMEEGTFIRWLKADGEMVRAGEPLFELEGEKALQEVEAVDSGTLSIDPAGPKEGAVVAVESVLGVLLEPGEVFAGWGSQAANAPVSAPPDQSTARSDPDRSHPAPPVQKEGSAPIASPRARRVASELGVEWKDLSGSGRGGRVRERDVRQASASTPRHAPQEDSAQHLRIEALSSRRRTIAERMAASCRQVAPVTLTTRCDATNLVSLRRQFQAAGGSVPAYTDLVAKLAALVLREHPRLAARWRESELELPANDSLHIGVAVDTDEGLLVPVLRDVARRSLSEIAQESKRLIEQARAGRLNAADMQGGVFTITNLGAYGIDAFTPIINLPEVAILGLGAIRHEAIVLDDGQIAPREMLTLSLTFDHRAVDGAPAARFLQALAGALTNPAAWLI